VALCWQYCAHSVCYIEHCGLDGPGIKSRWRQGIPHPSRPALRPSQPPLQRIPALSLRVKRPGRGVNHPRTHSFKGKHYFFYSTRFIKTATLTFAHSVRTPGTCRAKCSPEQQKRNVIQPDQGLSHWRTPLHCVERSIKIGSYRSQETSLVAVFIIRLLGLIGLRACVLGLAWSRHFQH